MGNSESSVLQEGPRKDSPQEGEGLDAATTRAKNRLEELEAEPLPPPETSHIDDFQHWWDELNLEELAKSLLDDLVEAITGCRSLSQVRRCTLRLNATPPPFAAACTTPPPACCAIPHTKFEAAGSAQVALMPGAAWQPDDARGSCNLCDEVFGLMLRKHHCRHCGLLFCGDCANHFMFLSQDKVKFKFRICADCKDDDVTAENIRVNAGEAVASVTRVAKAVGRAARERHHSMADVGETAERTSGALQPPIEMPTTEALSQALGMEDGEELSFDFGGQTTASTAALIATPEDDDDADPFGGDDAVPTEDTPWWEDTFFDSSLPDPVDGGLMPGGDDEYAPLPEVGSGSIGSMMGSGSERFMSFNDWEEAEEAAADDQDSAAATEARLLREALAGDGQFGGGLDDIDPFDVVSLDQVEDGSAPPIGLPEPVE